MAASGVTTYRAQKAREKSGGQSEEPNEWELGGIRVPGSLLRGTPLVKFSEKKGKAPRERLFRLDANQGRMLWDSKRRGVINIENIKELRLGPSAHSEMALLLPHEDTVALEDRWLTIIYTIEDSYKTLHVIAPTADILTQWYETLSQLRQLRLDFMAGILQSSTQGSEVWNRHHFAGADKSGDQRLDFSEVKLLCRRLNLGQKESEIKRRFEEADKEGNKTLSYEEFRDFVIKLKERTELRPIFDEIKGKGDFTYTVFETFMKNTQKSTLSPKELQSIYQQFIPTPPSQSSDATSPDIKTSSWSLESFTSFLNSGYNSVFSDWVTPPPASQGTAVPPPSQKTNVYQDMTQPLSSYYICSSHNTYLIGNQLVGASSVEGYVRALLGGCRSVELDIYDGPETGLGGAFSVTVSNTISTEVGDIEERVTEAVEAAEEAVESGNILVTGAEQQGVTSTYKGIIPGEPIVTHGGTLTSSLAVRHICEAIERYAFVTSPYPVIISGELHLSIPQQKVLVKVMREVFGDKLVVAPIDGDDADIMLPSPEELKGRILLKAKNKVLESKHKGDDEEDHDEEAEETKEVSKKTVEAEEKETWGGEIRSVGKKMGKMFGFGKRHDKSAERAKGTETADHSSKDGHTVTPTTSTPAPVPSKTVPPAKTDAPVVVATTTTVTPAPSYPPASPQIHVQTTLVQDTEVKEPADVTQTGSANTPIGKQLMAPELVPLLVYTSGVSFRGLSPNAGYAPSQVFSLSENRAKSLIHNPKQAEVKDSLKSSARDSALLVEHTREHLVRVYPKGTRVDSSNYEPNVFWAVGCQLVTLNWQTVDRGWHLNRAMYLRNGGSGYVLKPQALLDSSYPFDHQQHHRTKHILRIRVISAQQLPRPKDSLGHEVVDKNTVDPYVKVTLHIPIWASGQTSESIAPVPINRSNSSASVGRPGRSSTPVPKERSSTPVPGEVTSMSSKQEGVLTESGPAGDEQAGAAVGEREVKAKTRTIPNNGFNPIWNEELKLPFDVFGAGMRDLIFVRFLVKSSKIDKDDTVGAYCTSLGSLELGYRHLPLYDEQVSQILFASLFVHISIEDL